MKIQSTVIGLVFILSSSSIYAQHDHSSHQKSETHENIKDQKSIRFENDKFTLAYNSYTQLKDALAADDNGGARKSAAHLSGFLAGLQNGDSAKVESRKISEAKSIKEQRLMFVKLNDEMRLLIKENELLEGEIYLAYCPMANENNGAYWLSNEKEIHNPYFGSKMSKCGSIKEIIE
jgi:hypothetical protein